MAERPESDDFEITKCGVCKKKFDFDKLFFVDSCGHTFCRPCLSSHTIKCLEEKKTPFCLTCNNNLQVFESKVKNNIHRYFSYHDCSGSDWPREIRCASRRFIRRRTNAMCKLQGEIFI